MKNLLNIGFINNIRGLKGEIKVTHFCDYKEVFSSLFRVYIDDKEYEIEYVKYHKETVILKLNGVNTPEDAQNLKGKEMFGEREALPQLEEGRFYIEDLKGLKVFTDKNEYVGEVDDVILSSASDLFQIKTEDNRFVLVPNIPNFVQSISIDENKIVITPIEGLI